VPETFSHRSRPQLLSRLGLNAQVPGCLCRTTNDLRVVTGQPLLRDSSSSGPPRITPEKRQALIQEVFAQWNRPALDELTRRIWRRYARGEGATLNAEPLRWIRAAIEARREAVRRDEHMARGETAPET
jgi:hypothetical protein